LRLQLRFPWKEHQIYSQSQRKVFIYLFCGNFCVNWYSILPDAMALLSNLSKFLLSLFRTKRFHYSMKESDFHVYTEVKSNQIKIFINIHKVEDILYSWPPSPKNICWSIKLKCLSPFMDENQQRASKCMYDCGDDLD